jgi:hypothetical protein
MLFLFFILRSPDPLREGSDKHRDSLCRKRLPGPNASCPELLPIKPYQYWERNSQDDREHGEKRVAQTEAESVEHLRPKQGKRKGEHGPGDLQRVHVIVQHRQ